MKRARLFVSIVPAVVSACALTAHADYITILPTPQTHIPVTHSVTGAPAIQWMPELTIHVVNAENPSDPTRVYAHATYEFSETSLFINAVSLARTAGSDSSISGFVAFRVNLPVFYSLAGQVDVEGSGTPGSTILHSMLTNMDANQNLFNFYQNDSSISALLDVTAGSGSLPSTANGLLEANTTYMWFYSIALDSVAGTTGPATGNGYMVLNLTWTGENVPEPGTLSVLGIAAGGLLLRRRR